MRYFVNPQKFRSALAKLNLSYADAALKLNLTPADVEDFATRTYYVYEKRAADFARLFGVDVIESGDDDQTKTKRDLIQAVQRETGLPKSLAADAVNAVFSEIAAALLNNNKILIPGFGTFLVKTRNARQGTNPRTGETIDLPESKRVFFSQSKSIARALNGDDYYGD